MTVSIHDGGISHLVWPPRWLSGKEPTCRRRRRRRRGFSPWVGKISWRRKRQPTPVFSPEESPRTEEPGGLQSMRSQESDVTEHARTCVILQQGAIILLIL